MPITQGITLTATAPLNALELMRHDFTERRQNLWKQVFQAEEVIQTLRNTAQSTPDRSADLNRSADELEGEVRKLRGLAYHATAIENRLFIEIKVCSVIKDTLRDQALAKLE